MNTDIVKYIKDAWIYLYDGVDGRAPTEESDEVYLLEPPDDCYKRKQKVKAIVYGDCVVRITGKVCNKDGQPIDADGSLARDEALRKLRNSGLSLYELKILGLTSNNG